MTVGRAALLSRGLRLEYLTVGWNVAEGLIAIAAGLAAGSIALVGFGVDSAIEVTASAAALWRLARDGDDCAREAAERRTLRIVGACFLALAAYVLYESVTSLLRREAPEVSAVGIALAALSLIAMPVLVRLKRRVARQLGSQALEAESRQTLLCAVLSAILLAGLGLNAALGWWWADPLAGYVLLAYAVKEGVWALRH